MMKIFNTFLLGAAITMLAAGTVHAQTSVGGMECGVERKVPAGALQEQTYNRLNRIYEQIGEEEYDEAYSELEKLLGRTRDDYGRATIFQAQGISGLSRNAIAKPSTCSTSRLSSTRCPTASITT